MTFEPPRPGYLAEVEASHVTLTALPGAVVMTLKRDMARERKAGRRPRRMFIELSVSEAVQLWRILGADIRKAGALARQPSHVDAAANL
jgi:hypothetical protein